jgi:TrmH family RNA methyltransferase
MVGEGPPSTAYLRGDQVVDAGAKPRHDTWIWCHVAEAFAMTGREDGADLAPIGNSPVVILVRPQLADNIGACARAMANGGLFHLRLVAPRDGWPQHKAWRNSSGAHRILDCVTVYVSVADAVADLHHVFATCPRPRHIVKPVLTARGAAAELREICTRDLRAGVMFGPERAGLDNDDMAHADALVRYPLNPAFMSLNLAQAVMVFAYEWWMATEATPPRELMTNETQVATKAELENFLTHLVDQLDACGFLRNAPKRPGMVRNIRHFFQRGEVTEQELRTLHGIVTELAIGRRQMGRIERE